VVYVVYIVLSGLADDLLLLPDSAETRTVYTADFSTNEPRTESSVT